MKKLVNILIVLFILIVILITVLIYTTKIKITDITELTNEKSNYKIIFQAVGEPEWTFGRTKVRVTLVNSNGKRIRSFEEYISNDGALAQKENIKVNWYEDYVKIILIGEEQEDDIHKIYFKN